MKAESPQEIAATVRDRLTPAKAAEHLGCSASLLGKMRSEGRGPAYLRLHGRVFYRRTDLDAYIARALVETADSRAAA